MRNFSNRNAALEYAEDNVGKYDYIICRIANKPSFVCSTSVPIEEKLRDPIEIAVAEFLKLFDVKNPEDIIAEIGANTCEFLRKQIEDIAKINIDSAYMSY